MKSIILSKDTLVAISDERICTRVICGRVISSYLTTVDVDIPGFGTYTTLIKNVAALCGENLHRYCNHIPWTPVFFR